MPGYNSWHLGRWHSRPSFERPIGSVPPCSVNPGIEERVVTADLRYGWVAETPTMTEEARDDRGEDGTVGVRAEERRAGLPAGAAAVHGAAPDGVRGRWAPRTH